MTKSQPLHTVVCSLIAAVCLAPSALAAIAVPSGQGEAKNEAPFTDAYNGDPGLAQAYAKIATLQAQVTGEAKNTPRSTGSVGSRSGFNWIDASIGALAALGTCLLLAGAIALRGRPFRGQTPVAPVNPGALGRSVV